MIKLNMKYIIVFFLLTLIYFSCSSFKEYKYADKEIVRNYCYQCHTPYYSTNGIHLSKVYPMFGSDRAMRKYLFSEFVYQNSVKEAHRELLLSKEDVNSIGAYLKHIYINH